MRANEPAIGAIERGKKAAVEAASTHAIPKIFAFPVIVCMLVELVVALSQGWLPPFGRLSIIKIQI